MGQPIRLAGVFILAPTKESALMKSMTCCPVLSVLACWQRRCARARRSQMAIPTIASGRDAATASIDARPRSLPTDAPGTAPNHLDRRGDRIDRRFDKSASAGKPR
jgi:hypothetical protein